MRFSVLRALGALALSFLFAAPLTAQQPPVPAGTWDAAIAARIGTPGFGVEVSKLFTPNVGGRVGASFFSFSKTKSQTDITYDARIKAHSFEGLIDLYPHARGNFHFTGGFYTNPVTVSGTGVPTSGGTFKINGTQYDSSEVGVLSAKVKYPGVGPYVGLGWGTGAKKGGAIGFNFDLGAVIGKAKLALNATGAANDPQLASDLAAQQATTQHDIQKFAKVYPVLSFGISYHR